MVTPSPPLAPYADLTPSVVLDALDTVGLRGDGRIIQLNSYENRVFQVFLEDGRVVVAKFYRPHRWTDEQILEEHAFALELAKDEIPVAPPLPLALVGSTGGRSTLSFFDTAHARYRFAVAERRAGRAPELDQPDVLEWLGRFIGRIHAVGARRPFQHRQTLTPALLGRSARDWLLKSGLIPPESIDGWSLTSEALLHAVEQRFASVGHIENLRLHGDCHIGNVLWTPHGPHFVDLDDALNGPAVQDLWMLLSGEPAAMRGQLEHLLHGYEAFRPFERRELRLIEPLRALRMLHYSAWIARRWEDPAFPAGFPWFGTSNYWAEQTSRLRDQLQILREEDEAPLA